MGKPSSQRPAHPVEALTNEIRLLFHQLVEAGESLHANEPITMGMRAVLEFLDRNGASTVPAVARSRGVSRQHIQTLVNALLDHEAVALQDNPAHKRSPLVALTSDGARIISRMRKREARFYETADLGVSKAEINRTTKTLRTVREALKGSQWRP